MSNDAAMCALQIVNHVWDLYCTRKDEERVDLCYLWDSQKFIGVIIRMSASQVMLESGFEPLQW